MTVTVMLVDDHPVVRAGLRAVLDARPGIDVIAEAGTGEDAVAQAASLHPQVVLCDLRLGSGMDGIETARAMRALDAAPAVLMLTTFDREADIIGAVQAGAAGYLLKDVSPDTIVDAVQTAAAGGMHLPPELAARVVAGLRSRPNLTERELEVMRLLATGASNREMAKELFVSEATIKSHLVHIFTKLDVDSRSRAIHVARERGIID